MMEKQKFNQLFWGYLFFLIGFSSAIQVVELPQGKVQGYLKESYQGRKYLAFEGIPYAQPPIGDLRFEEPQPAKPWNDILVANTTYSCSQFLPVPMMKSAQGTEDCLYLYIYTPLEEIRQDGNWDVIVNIHGGAFMLGSPRIVAGPDFIMDRNVIYVTFNYRLNILGFLSTEDDVVPGNNGLKDQQLAMKWVKENIKHFGGNPNSITLVGLSAGGASVHYHYLAPSSWGLFNRGQSQSGTTLSPWSLTKNPLTNAKQVASKLKCPTNTSKDMVDCLKKVPVKDLIAAVRSIMIFLDAIPYTPFGPVVETAGPRPFISEHPYKLLKDKKVYNVPWITSNVLEEGLFPVGFFVLLGLFDSLKDRWYEVMPYAMDINNTVPHDQWNATIDALKQHYFGNKEVELDNIYKLVQMFTDRIYIQPSELALRTHAKAVTSPVYYYFYSYLNDHIFPFKGIRPGVAHADDGKMMTRIMLTPNKYTERDEKMVEAFLDFITTYAATGKPTFKGVDWTPHSGDSANINHLYIDPEGKASMRQIKEVAPTDFYKSLPIRENDKLFE